MRAILRLLASALTSLLFASAVLSQDYKAPVRMQLDNSSIWWFGDGGTGAYVDQINVQLLDSYGLVAPNGGTYTYTINGPNLSWDPYTSQTTLTSTTPTATAYSTGPSSSNNETAISFSWTPPTGCNCSPTGEGQTVYIDSPYSLTLVSYTTFGAGTSCDDYGAVSSQYSNGYVDLVQYRAISRIAGTALPNQYFGYEQLWNLIPVVSNNWYATGDPRPGPIESGIAVNGLGDLNASDFVDNLCSGSATGKTPTPTTYIAPPSAGTEVNTLAQRWCVTGESTTAPVYGYSSCGGDMDVQSDVLQEWTDDMFPLSITRP